MCASDCACPLPTSMEKPYGCGLGPTAAAQSGPPFLAKIRVCDSPVACAREGLRHNWQGRQQSKKMDDCKLLTLKDLVRPAGLEPATSWFVVVSRK